MTKILHIDSGKTWRGGQAQVLLLLKGLRKLKVESVLAAPEGSPLFEKARSIGIKTIPVPLKGEWDIFSALKIKNIALKEKASLLHAHDARSHSIAWLASTMCKNFPVVVTRRVDFPISQNFISKKKYLSRNITYIAISEGVKNVLSDGGVLLDKITVAHSGIDTDKFGEISFDAPNFFSIPKFERAIKFPEEWGIASDNIIIGNVASLADHKGQKYLVEAAAILLRDEPRARFIIAGEGEERKNLERLIAANNLEKKFFLAGFQEKPEMWLRSFDIFVLSSHLEGLCTSLLDAMLLGIPCIATDVGGVPDIVKNGKTGLLVKPKNPHSIAAKIFELINNSEMRKQLALDAYENVLKNFSGEKMVVGTLKVYRKILNERD